MATNEERFDKIIDCPACRTLAGPGLQLWWRRPVDVTMTNCNATNEELDQAARMSGALAFLPHGGPYVKAVAPPTLAAWLLARLILPPTKVVEHDPTPYLPVDGVPWCAQDQRRRTAKFHRANSARVALIYGLNDVPSTEAERDELWKRLHADVAARFRDRPAT